MYFSKYKRPLTVRESSLLLSIIINKGFYKNFKNTESNVWQKIAEQWKQAISLNPNMTSPGKYQPLIVYFDNAFEFEIALVVMQ